MSFHSDGSRAQEAKSSAVWMLQALPLPHTGHGRSWLTDLQCKSIVADGMARFMSNQRLQLPCHVSPMHWIAVLAAAGT